MREVYETLRNNGANASLTHDDDWQRYLRQLPPFERAREYRAQQPLIAYIVGHLRPHPVLRDIGHVIVDESQDVHPLEWRILRDINAGGCWTILGDLNQRRSDHTESSWRRIAETLQILEAGKPPVTKLLRGYRSTRPIIQYANRLLPRAERELESLQQDGVEPTVIHTKSITAETTDQSLALLQRHPHGTVAIIAVDPNPIRNALRDRGWTADRGNRRRWTSNGRTIAVIHPDRARGLEYDAVLVVEPTDFPKNYGRQGQLYTALTRPNRELVVVHQKPLPPELQERRKR